MNATTFEAAAKAPTHPALRWRPIFGGDTRQHRREGTDLTGCGLAGPLTLADSDQERCTDGCWA